MTDPFLCTSSWVDSRLLDVLGPTCSKCEEKIQVSLEFWASEPFIQ